MIRFRFFRLAFFTFSQFNKKKLLLFLNLGIFLAIFALTAAIISIYHENEIEKLETKLIRNETTHIIYSKWLDAIPKEIKKIDLLEMEINNFFYNNKILEKLSYKEIEIPIIKPDWVSENNPEKEKLYSNKTLNNIIKKYITILFLLERTSARYLSESILVANSKEDLELIKSHKVKLNNYMHEMEDIWKEALKDDVTEDKNQRKKYLEIINKAHLLTNSYRDIFFQFGILYFSNKKKEHEKKEIDLHNKIENLSNIESIFIFSAFIIQLIIYVIAQFFEIFLENEKRKKRKAK